MIYRETPFIASSWCIHVLLAVHRSIYVAGVQFRRFHMIYNTCTGPRTTRWESLKPFSLPPFLPPSLPGLLLILSLSSCPIRREWFRVAGMAANYWMKIKMRSGDYLLSTMEIPYQKQLLKRFGDWRGFDVSLVDVTCPDLSRFKNWFELKLTKGVERGGLEETEKKNMMIRKKKFELLKARFSIRQRTKVMMKKKH